jgi:3-deoxy-D-manno-octulosonate 8-phosphate phosphatase (KDO 8-P phosphatase)
MIPPGVSLDDYFKGFFLNGSAALRQKYRNIKAFVFDWDGVFNNGHKNIDGHSTFSEADSMGLNMMRFSHHLLNRQLPPVAIITGENNQLAFSFARRENFDAVYFKMPNKELALQHFCEKHQLQPQEVMFVFDDVLDFSAARLAGVRIMVNRKASPLLTLFAENNRLVDYVTFFEGGQHALRELSELVMVITNNFNPTIEHRMRFSDAYRTYIELRKTRTPQFFSANNLVIEPREP